MDTPSGVLLTSSSSPALIRASGVIFKWTFLTAVFLGVGFMGLKYLVPILDELRHPERTNPKADKDASTVVKALRQTREVVAKSNSNVSVLDEVLAEVDKKTVAKKEAPKSPPPPKAAPSLVTWKKGDLTPFQEAVARVKFGGVFEGGEPRAYLDGRIVKYGEIFNRDLGLRFLGVDLEEHALLFTNADNVTFRKYY
ncbi:MAG: hypothetical protein EXS37_04255 [Opitutus sp.]|nr:hypothetical protein [Opitutus sp.]